MKNLIEMTSITYAYKAKEILNGLGYYCEIERTPKNLGSGCGYSVRIKDNPDLITAQLNRYSVPYKQVLRLDGGAVIMKGTMQYGGHIIISGYEHNAVARPVYALSQTRGVTYSIARVFDDTEQTIREFEWLCTAKTKCICCSIASNVTGRIMPYKEIAELCKRKGICFIADGAQVSQLIAEVGSAGNI